MRGRRSVAIAVSMLALSQACRQSHAPAADVCGGTPPGVQCRTLIVGGVTRTYLLYVPASFAARPRGGSLVIALHGLGEVAADLSNESGLNAEADTAGFIVAYPNALVPPNAFNHLGVWQTYFATAFGANPPDDIGFLRQLVLTLEQERSLDPGRIFVTGLSNGAVMTHRVGVELSDLVAAIAVVSGSLANTENVSRVPDAKAPVSVLMLHGDKDDNVPCCPLKGGATQDETFDYWVSARANACSVVSTPAAICDGPETPSALPEKHATGCREGVEVRFYKLFGGRHHWYTAPMNDSLRQPFNPQLSAASGVTTPDIIWRFFSTHSKL